MDIKYVIDNVVAACAACPCVQVEVDSPEGTIRHMVGTREALDRCRMAHMDSTSEKWHPSGDPEVFSSKLFHSGEPLFHMSLMDQFMHRLDKMEPVFMGKFHPAVSKTEDGQTYRVVWQAELTDDSVPTRIVLGPRPNYGDLVVEVLQETDAMGVKQWRRVSKSDAFWIMRQAIHDLATQ